MFPFGLLFTQGATGVLTLTGVNVTDNSVLPGYAAAYFRFGSNGYLQQKKYNIIDAFTNLLGHPDEWINQDYAQSGSFNPAEWECGLFDWIGASFVLGSSSTDEYHPVSTLPDWGVEANGNTQFGSGTIKVREILTPANEVTASLILTANGGAI